MPAVGDQAPPFDLSDQDGSSVKLSSLKGRKVMLYFYPRADTPGCTTQACGLRDVAGEIGDTVVLGISPDEPPALRRFDDKHSLGFLLLSDPDHATAVAYGAWGEKKMYGTTSMGIIRSAYLLDEEGVVVQRWSPISPKDTPTKLQAALVS